MCFHGSQLRFGQHNAHMYSFKWLKCLLKSFFHLNSFFYEQLTLISVEKMPEAKCIHFVDVETKTELY